MIAHYGTLSLALQLHRKHASSYADKLMKVLMVFLSPYMADTDGGSAGNSRIYKEILQIMRAHSCADVS